MDARASRFWSVVFRVGYAILRVTDPLLHLAWRAESLGITSRLTVAGRRTGRERSVLVGLIRVDGRWYVGHPNGEVDWTANLRAAGRARLEPRHRVPVEVTAEALPVGAERDAVIRATARQQPFPANLLYRAARRHVLAQGRYFRLEAR